MCIHPTTIRGSLFFCGCSPFPRHDLCPCRPCLLPVLPTYLLRKKNVHRRSTMDPASREALLASCPGIVKAVGDVLSSTAAEAASSSAAAAASATAATAATADAGASNGEKKAAPKAPANVASSTMLKAKRMKPLLACLSAAIGTADGGGDGSALFSGPKAAAASEARALRAALEAVGEASASLAMQLQCGQVAQELDAVAPAGAEQAAAAAEEDDKKKKKKKRKAEDGEASPKTPKRKAAQVDGPATPAGAGDAAAAAEGEDAEAAGKSSSSSKKKKKKRRESKEG